LNESTRDRKIEDVLTHMGVRHGGREYSYPQWYRFVEVLRRYSGQEEERVLNLARSYVGIGLRYLHEYLEACKAWGVAYAEDGKLFYVGLPKGVKLPKGKPSELEPPPEK
jgi:hypothetical protein